MTTVVVPHYDTIRYDTVDLRALWPRVIESSTSC